MFYSETRKNVTFMLPCIVIDFLLNNQPDALIIKIYSVKRTESGWNCSSVLTLLGSGYQKPAWNLPVPNVQ